MKHTSKNIDIFVLCFLKKKRKDFIIILTLNQLRTTDCSENHKTPFSKKYTPPKKITLLENDKIITNDSDIAFTNIVDLLEIEGFPTKHVDYNFEINHIANIIAKFKEHPSIFKIKEHPSILNIKEHPSILKIKDKINIENPFNFSISTEADITANIKALDVKKPTTFKNIPTRILAENCDIVSPHLTRIYNDS